MNKFAFVFLVVFLPFAATAQKPPLKFGDVSKEELLMTSYDKDTSAAAVILADFGVSGQGIAKQAEQIVLKKP